MAYIVAVPQVRVIFCSLGVVRLLVDEERHHELIFRVLVLLRAYSHLPDLHLPFVVLLHHILIFSACCRDHMDIREKDQVLELFVFLFPFAPDGDAVFVPACLLFLADLVLYPVPQVRERINYNDPISGLHESVECFCVHIKVTLVFRQRDDVIVELIRIQLVPYAFRANVAYSF